MPSSYEQPAWTNYKERAANKEQLVSPKGSPTHKAVEKKPRLSTRYATDGSIGTTSRSTGETKVGGLTLSLGSVGSSGGQGAEDLPMAPRRVVGSFMSTAVVDDDDVGNGNEGGRRGTGTGSKSGSSSNSARRRIGGGVIIDAKVSDDATTDLPRLLPGGMLALQHGARRTPRSLTPIPDLKTGHRLERSVSKRVADLGDDDEEEEDEEEEGGGGEEEEEEEEEAEHNAAEAAAASSASSSSSSSSKPPTTRTAFAPLRDVSSLRSSAAARGGNNVNVGGRRIAGSNDTLQLDRSKTMALRDTLTLSPAPVVRKAQTGFH